MLASMFIRLSKSVLVIVSSLAFCNEISAQQKEPSPSINFKTVTNKNGPTLGYSPASGVKLLVENGLQFKDLNRNGKLDKYEDWRLSADDRAVDLASKLTIAEIAGLMLYSGHQAVPANPR